MLVFGWVWSVVCVSVCVATAAAATGEVVVATAVSRTTTVEELLRHH